MSEKWVYLYDEIYRGEKNIFGSNGVNMSHMVHSGVSVPFGFIITTKAYTYYCNNGKQFPKEMWKQVLDALEILEKKTGKVFGGLTNPLLLSVSTDSEVPMIGLTDTILNLGMNGQCLQGLASFTSNLRFAQNTYMYFIESFGKIVMGIDNEKLEQVIDQVESYQQNRDIDLSSEELIKVVDLLKHIIKEESNTEFPESPYDQLYQAIITSFNSWNSQSAINYRQRMEVPENLGTAICVQMMVFSNLNSNSTEGVFFTRNPGTGETEIFGEYMASAQEKDGLTDRRIRSIVKLREDNPKSYQQLAIVAKQLEKYYRDTQEITFVIEQGKLWILGTRKSRRAARAAIKIAVDLANEGIIDKATAVKRIDLTILDQLLYPTISSQERININTVVTGLPASPGTVSGKAVFDAHEAKQLAVNGEKLILVRPETSPEDFHGIVASQALLTVHGGRTSHAAVVARGMGKPCVVGAGALQIDLINQKAIAENLVIKKGDWLTLDGSTGEVFLGQLPIVEVEPSNELSSLIGWADELRRLKVRANADTPYDVKMARRLGAEGIGLCRTEHMFLERNRISEIRKIIIAENLEERKTALANIELLQQNDFEEIFREMEGLPVAIRTLDLPLHEFLPRQREEIQSLADALGVSFEKVKARIERLHEVNPMLGFRGCRLGIIYPEVTEMQSRAAFKAAVAVKRAGIEVHLEVMIPLVSSITELELQEAIVRRVATEVQEEAGIKIQYLVGTMIELPRAAIVADEIAKVAEFFSFGTNDLTQTTFGLSRDDISYFLPQYIDRKVFLNDPFQTIDRQGVGYLIQLAAERGHRTRPMLEVGICGEHGGDPISIQFFHEIGLSYVSCSPYRLPIARLAAAQAAII